MKSMDARDILKLGSDVTDSLLAEIKEAYPYRTESWRQAFCLRLVHYSMHSRDMNGDPSLFGD